MWLEAIYNCTHLGGDPNYSIYQIGDRVVVSDSQLYIEKDVWPPSGSKKEKKKQAMERARHEEMLKMLYEQQRITLANTVDQSNTTSVDPARDQLNRYITVDQEGLGFQVLRRWNF